MKRNQTRQRTVWITGASSGIGKALAEIFAHNGDRVVASSRRSRELLAFSKKRLENGGVIHPIVCDVRKSSEIERTMKRIVRSFGPVDVLINNAGVTYYKDFTSTTVKEFDNALSTNLRGSFLTTKAVLPSMMRRKFGFIVNIISYAARTTYTHSVAYSASKSGTEAMMNVLRAEVRGKGIKVVNVYPGAVLTPMWRKHDQARYSRVMMKPTDLARLVYKTTVQPDTVMIEELVVRPQVGDLTVK